MKRAVFLDRDGTINEDVGYVTDPSMFELIPGSVEAIRRLKEAGFFLVMATNQACVGKGLIVEPQLIRVLDAFQDLLDEDGARLDAVRFCPHHPDEGLGVYARDCDCRKPGAGQLLSAAEEHAIDLPTSFMVGDHWSDVQAGLSAGCRSVLVLTGHGAMEYECADKKLRGSVDCVAPDLTGAVDWILKQ